VRWRLNDAEYELVAHRIANVTELRAHMAKGALLYWTMVRPAHALLLDPERRTVAQLAFFKPLWGLQRSRQIRQDRYDGIYQVFVPTAPATEPARAAQRPETPRGGQLAPPTAADHEGPHFEPRI